MNDEKKLNKVRALAAFSPDALSSVAYANQEIYLGLISAGAAGLSLSFPIAVGIFILLAIVAFSYTQSIPAYPNGGGSYAVACENLGTLPGLVAAAALLVDYILNAAVSLTAGVAALASAFPSLWHLRVPLALGLLAIITLLNLRGLREAGTFMAVPVYLFLVTFIAMLLYGLARAAFNLPAASYAVTAPPAVNMLSAGFVLHAFAAGCTALTGIEAISNGVPSFRKPEVKNARQTQIILAVLMSFLFISSMGLTQYLGVVAGPDETILSALSRQLLGSNIAYYIIQFSTLAVLTVAANTSFASFPWVTSVLASDLFMPRLMRHTEDRLVSRASILLLAGITAGLIILFQGDTHLLIPLFAVGAFLAFTLAQAGMVRHWARNRSPGWQWKATLSMFGAVITALATLIVAASRFSEGTWISVLLIPLLIALFYRIRRHYSPIGGG